MTKAPPYCTTRSSVMRYEDRRNFREYLTGEVRRILLPRTSVNSSVHEHLDLTLARLPPACCVSLAGRPDEGKCIPDAGWRPS
jgi:hypothetical protein